MLQSITEKYRPKSINDLVFVNKTFETKMKEWCYSIIPIHIYYK